MFDSEVAAGRVKSDREDVVSPVSFGPAAGSPNTSPRFTSPQSWAGGSGFDTDQDHGQVPSTAGSGSFENEDSDAPRAADPASAEAEAAGAEAGAAAESPRTKQSRWGAVKNSDRPDRLTSRVKDTLQTMSDATAEDEVQTQLELIKQLFAEADASETGDLDVKELGWVMEKLGMKMSHEQLHAALGVLDVDDSGAVSLANFTEWWEKNGHSADSSDETRSRALEAFKTVDFDGGGTIDSSELSALADKVGLDLSEAELADAIKEMDADGSGEIDFEEFFQWYSNGSASTTGLAVGLGLGLGLGDTADGQQLFEVVEDEDSDDEFDAAAAAGEMFNDLMAASLGGSKDVLGLSLGMFTPDNAFRVAVSKIVFHPMTEVGILVCIVINVVALLFQEPGADQIELVSFINFVCGLIFTVEMVLRIITHGFVRHEGAYLRNAWNALDCVIVLTYWGIYITAMYSEVDSSLSSCATLLRSFRCLRFFGGVREVLSALAQGSSMILTVSAVMIFLFVAFSTSARSLFGGVLMNRCAVPDPAQRSLDCPFCGDEPERCPTVLECGFKNLTCFEYRPTLEYKYTNQSYYATPRRVEHIDKFGFDGVLESLLTVYTISTLDEWGYLCNMYRSSGSSTAIYAWPVFAALTVLLALFATNLFVASVTIAYMSVRTGARDDNTLDGIRDMVMANLEAGKEGEEEFLQGSEPGSPSNDGTPRVATPGGMDDYEEWEGDDDPDVADEDLSEAVLRKDHCLGTCCKFSPALTEWSQVVIQDKRFDNFIMFTVLVNICLMASEHHGMEQWYVDVLYVFEIIFTVIYTFEVSVKLQGMGWRRYFKTGMNRLDFAIVFIAHAGNILTYFGSGMDASSSQSLRIVKVLARLARLMRVARVGKLISRVKSIRTVLKVAFGSLDAIASLSFLFVFVCFVGAMMGTFIFWTCHVNPDGTVRRTELNGMDFGGLRNSFFSVFQLSTGDDWSGLMFEYMECFGNGAAVYFVVVVFVTQYLLLNLYISVFLENFQLNDEQKRQRQIEEYTQREIANMDDTEEGAAIATIAIANTLSRATPMGRLKLDQVIHTIQDGIETGLEKTGLDVVTTQAAQGVVGLLDGGADVANKSLELVESVEHKVVDVAEQAVGTVVHDILHVSGDQGLVPIDEAPEGKTMSERAKAADEAYKNYEKALSADLEKGKLAFSNPLLSADEQMDGDGTDDEDVGTTDKATEPDEPVDQPNVALGLFPEGSPFRAAMTKLVESDGFDRVIVVCIALSGMHIALEGPDTYATSGLPQWFQDSMDVLNVVLFVTFWVELLCKLVAYGFIGHPDSYLKRSSSNTLDFIVVLATSVDVVLALLNFSSSAKLFRLLRVLRLVRLLLIIDGMQIILYTLMKALPSVSAILALQATSFLVFGILGINMFAGQYYRCIENISLARWDCDAAGLTWARYEFNFDNIGEACASLFVCMTVEGWIYVMRIGMDTPDAICVDCAPTPNGSASVAFGFFASFMIVNAFMLDKLFVGVLVDFFQQESGSALMTSEQKNWRFMEVMAMHIIDADRRPPTGSKIREECFRIAQWQPFTRMVNIFIMLDVSSVVLGDSDLAPQALTDIFRIVDELTLAVYTYEALVRIGAYGWRGYIKTDKTPFAIVLIMWLMTVHFNLSQFEWFDPSGSFDWIQGLSFVMILRMTRLLSASVQVRKLLKLIYISLPQVANLVTVMFLQFFIFGILGMKLYGSIPLEGTDVKLDELNEYNNFATVPSAMMLLFQIATGQPIVKIVEEIKASVGGHPFIFFAVFFIFANMILLNLFTALLLDNLDLMGASDFGITDADVNWFHKRWHAFGLYVNDDIHIRSLRGFVMSIGGSFAVVTAADKHWYKRLLLDLEVPPEEMNETSTRTFSFHRVLLCLCHLRFNSSCLPYELEVAATAKAERMNKNHAARMIILFWRAHKMIKNVPTEYQGSQDDTERWYAAVYVARLWTMDAVNRVYKMSDLESVESKTKNLSTAMQIMSGWSGPEVEGDEDAVVQMDELGDEHLEKLAEGDAEAHEMLLARMEEIHQQRVKVAGGIGTWCVGGKLVGKPFAVAQTFVLTFVLPIMLVGLFHVLIKIIGQHHMSIFSPEFVILVVFPVASYVGCCYIVAQYFLVPSLFSARRQMLMFSSWAGIANYGAILYGLTDEGRQYCQLLAIVNNAAYLTQMAWQVTATYTAFRFVKLGKLRVKGLWRLVLQLTNWLGPLLLTLALFFSKPEAFHESLDELKGLGWCGVRGDPEFMYWKLFFILIPQLTGVSIYAYCFSYIIDVVDPPETTVMRRSADDSRVSTSHHEDLLYASDSKQAVAMARAADRIKLYLTGFMLSYLTNTLLTIFLEREKKDSEWTTFDYLICAAVVTPQQALYARVFNSGGGSGIVSGIANFHKSSVVSASGAVVSNINSMAASYKWVQIMQASSIGQTVTVQVRSTTNQASSAFQSTLNEANRQTKQAAKVKPKNPWAENKAVVFIMGYVNLFAQWGFNTWQACVMVPVALWVWTPIEFIKENFTQQLSAVMVALLGYGLFLLVPVFYFRVDESDSLGTVDSSGTGLDYSKLMGISSAADVWDRLGRGPTGVFVYMSMIALIGIIGAYANRFNFDLLVIDGPRDKIRKTKKNYLGVYTLVIEWFQIAMLVFTGARILQRYRGPRDNDDGEMTVQQFIVGLILDNVFYVQYYMSLVGVAVWASCYAGPAIVEKLYSRKRSIALQRNLGVLFFVLSGPGFLTIMKSLMKPLFCIYEQDTYPYPVTVADKDLQCWTREHLNLVWPALCALCIYFPTATLTTAIKYSPDEDIRYVFLYTRLEFITKGLMLFFSLKFINEPIIAILFLMLGSCAIMGALYYMKPCCQLIAMRWKFFVHTSNLWTCTTCIWALMAKIDHTNWQTHLYIASVGWLVIFAAWVYTIRKNDKEDVLNAPIEDPTTVPRACSEILELRHHIGYAQRQHVWGVHAAVLRLLDFAKHEDETVRLKAFEAFATLSFWDHVTDKAFFIEMTPNTCMKIFLNAVTKELDESLRIFAVRVLGSFVRAQLHIKELNQYIEEDNGDDVSNSIAKLACTTVRPEARVDCMQTLLALTYVDSNTLDAIAAHCIEMLGGWAQKGSLVEQHLAAEILMLMSGRFDLTADLIADGALPKLVSLFMAVDDIEAKPETLKVNQTDGFRAGCLPPQRSIIFAHQVPPGVRPNFQKMYRRVKHIYADKVSSDSETGDTAAATNKMRRAESKDTQRLRGEGGAARASSWSAWCSSGVPLAIEIKKKLIAQGFEGVSKVRSAGVTRTHLDELFAIMYETRDAELDTPINEGSLGGTTIASYLATIGLGNADEIEQILFDTGLYQHGIGELNDNSIHEQLSREVFSRWLLMSRPENQGEQSPRELSGDSLAFRVLRECLPQSREPGCDLIKLESDVDTLYSEVLAKYGAEYSGQDALILHKHDLASYLANEKGMYGGTSDELLVDMDKEMSIGEAELDAHVQLSATQLQIMKNEITKATVQTLTEIAIAQGAQGRGDMVDGGVLLIISRCFALFKPPDVHILALNMLHALMNGRFSEEDIGHDADLMGFYSEIQEFNVRLERDPTMPPLLQFERLSAMERRKAHMMAAFLGMYHRSVGSPVNRKVIVSRDPITKDLIAKILAEEEGLPQLEDELAEGAESAQPLTQTAKKQGAQKAVDVVFVNPMGDSDEDEDDPDGVSGIADRAESPQFVVVGGGEGGEPQPTALSSAAELTSTDAAAAARAWKESTTSLQRDRDAEILIEDERIFESSREKIANTGIIAAVRQRARLLLPPLLVLPRGRGPNAAAPPVPWRSIQRQCYLSPIS
jgi:Ca2+-binding EF-hand superfamily protein